MRTYITYRGVELEVEYDYIQSTDQILYNADGGRHERRSGGVDVIDVRHGDDSIYALVEDNMDDIEDLTCESHYG